MKSIFFLVILVTLCFPQELNLHLSDGSVYQFTLAEIDTITISLPTTQTNNEMKVPVSLKLYQNYPNPFNPSTTISYQLPQSSYVTISIFNLRGQLIKTIAEKNNGKGKHTVQWHGFDESGNQVSTGLYFYVIQTDATVLSKKMILIK